MPSQFKYLAMILRSFEVEEPPASAQAESESQEDIDFQNADQVRDYFDILIADLTHKKYGLDVVTERFFAVLEPVFPDSKSPDGIAIRHIESFANALVDAGQYVRLLLYLATLAMTKDCARG